MNTNTVTAGYTFDEAELSIRDYYSLPEGSSLAAFADCCVEGNTVDELRSALAEGTAHWSCEADCAEWGIAAEGWLEALRAALAFKLHY